MKMFNNNIYFFFFILFRDGGLPSLSGKIWEYTGNNCKGGLITDMQIEDERAICMEAMDTEERQCEVDLVGLDQMSLVPHQEIQGETIGLKVGMEQN